MEKPKYKKSTNKVYKCLSDAITEMKKELIITLQKSFEECSQTVDGV